MMSKKVFYAMLSGTLLMVLLVIVAVVVGDTSLRKQSSKLSSLKLENNVVDAQETALNQAKKDIEKYSDLESIAKQIVPQDKDQARAAREIVNIAAQAGVKIASISFPASTLGQVAPKATKPAEGSDTTATPTTPTTTETQVKPVDGIQGLYKLEIVVNSDTTSPASYEKLINFLNGLEKNRRTAQVSQITILPDPLKRSSLNFNLTITVYIKP